MMNNLANLTTAIWTATASHIAKFDKGSADKLIMLCFIPKNAVGYDLIAFEEVFKGFDSG